MCGHSAQESAGDGGGGGGDGKGCGGDGGGDGAPLGGGETATRPAQLVCARQPSLSVNAPLAGGVYVMWAERYPQLLKSAAETWPAPSASTRYVLPEDCPPLAHVLSV
jgi:hypothetical protein